MIGINVTLSDEQIDRIASSTADKVLFTNNYYKNNEDWYDKKIKDLEQALSKRDSMLVQKDLYIERLRERAKELSITENMIAEYRSNYNKQIKEYNRYVKKFPSKQAHYRYK